MGSNKMTRTLLKTATVYKRSTDGHVFPNIRFVYESDDGSFARKEFTINRATWEELGRPHEITVTIEPGNTLEGD